MADVTRPPDYKFLKDTEQRLESTLLLANKNLVRAAHEYTITMPPLSEAITAASLAEIAYMMFQQQNGKTKPKRKPR